MTDETEPTVASQEADYHAERAMLLEQQRDDLVELLKLWWGGLYGTQYCLDLQETTETKLAEIARSKV